MERTNYVHRHDPKHKKAWATIKRLNYDKHTQSRIAAVTPNQVVNQLLLNRKPTNQEKGHQKRRRVGGFYQRKTRDSYDPHENGKGIWTRWDHNIDDSTLWS